MPTGTRPWALTCLAEASQLQDHTLPLNSGDVPRGYVLLYNGMGSALPSTVADHSEAQEADGSGSVLDCGAHGFVFYLLTVPFVIASVLPTMCLTSVRAENTEIIFLSSGSQCNGYEQIAKMQFVSVIHGYF